MMERNEMLPSIRMRRERRAQKRHDRMDALWMALTLIIYAALYWLILWGEFVG